MTATVNLQALSNRDQQAAVYIIQQRNLRMTEENTRRAAQVPPLAALPLLPFATNAEIKTSYETLMAEAVMSLHANYMADEAAANGPNKKEFVDAFKVATPQQRTNALAALTA